jgi:hypothetical protein
MLKYNKSSWIAVLPDAIIISDTNSPDRLYQEEEKQVFFDEMNTKLTGNTIASSVDRWEKHGKLVYCFCGDDVFKDCVPSEIRSQLIHQSLVTNLTYGVECL